MRHHMTVNGPVPFSPEEEAEWDAREAQAVLLESERLKSQLIQQTQNRLDEFARTRNYDGILSLCTYATSSVPKFAAEGQRGVDIRDQTWATLYTIMDEVQQGMRPMQIGFSDIEPDLPALEWPAA